MYQNGGFNFHKWHTKIDGTDLSKAIVRHASSKLADVSFYWGSLPCCEKKPHLANMPIFGIMHNLLVRIKGGIRFFTLDENEVAA